MRRKQLGRRSYCVAFYVKVITVCVYNIAEAFKYFKFSFNVGFNGKFY